MLPRTLRDLSSTYGPLPSGAAFRLAGCATPAWQMIDPTYGVASAVSSALYGAFSVIVTVPAASSAVTLFAPAVPVTYEVYGPWVDGENAYRSESAITLGVIGVPSEQVTPLRMRSTAPSGVVFHEVARYGSSLPPGLRYSSRS